jgi:hypothetical protein
MPAEEAPLPDVQAKSSRDDTVSPVTADGGASAGSAVTAATAPSTVTGIAEEGKEEQE